jgi:hypothetical protein
MRFATPLRAVLSILLLLVVVFGAVTGECAACTFAGSCCHPDGSCSKVQAGGTSVAQQPTLAAPILPDLRCQPTPAAPMPVAVAARATEIRISVIPTALRI